MSAGGRRGTLLTLAGPRELRAVGGAVDGDCWTMTGETGGSRCGRIGSRYTCLSVRENVREGEEEGEPIEGANLARWTLDSERAVCNQRMTREGKEDDVG